MGRSDHKVMCDVCQAFTLHSNLKRHMRNKHGIGTSNPDKTVERDREDGAICKFCKKLFKRRKALLQHYRTVHSNDPGVLSECAWVEMYSCHLCSYRTARKNVLKCHITKTHVNLQSQTAATRIKCPICPFEGTRHAMLEHYQSAHDVRLVFENLKFNSETLFNKWKLKIEEEGPCKFCTSDSYKRADNRRKVVYRCQRDGVYKSKGKNARRPKSTSKINSVCPATLQVEIDPDGITSVSYCKTHFGHSADSVKNFLSKAERDELARKISEGLSFDEIINTFDSSKIRLKRKDLHNIVRDYSLSMESENGDDLVWIQEMLVLDNVIRFYKSRGGVLTEHPNLDVDNLTLVIMNDAQVEMARRNGTNVICACEVVADGISLMWISVLDEIGRAVPAAFMFSNRICARTVEMFVICFKEAVGYRLKPRILVTDEDENFADSWSKHMIEPDSRLYCSSCVEESWNKILKTILDKEKRIDIQTALNLMKVEPDKTTFSSTINNLINNWHSHMDTKQLASYFDQFYSRCVSRWASSCNSALDPIQAPFQSLHKSIKQIYLSGDAKPKKFDVAVKALMKHARDISLESLVHLSRNDAMMRLQPIKSRHDAAIVGLANQKIIRHGDLWKVPSLDGLKTHEVGMSKTDCSCEVRCDECKACIHSYTCSCPDSSLKFNFCKHIHAVCQHHLLHGSGANPPTSEELKGNYSFADSAELPRALDCTSDKGAVVDLEEEKRRLIMEFTAVVSRVDSAEHVKFIDRSLESLKTFPSGGQNCSSLSGDGGTGKLVYVAVPAENENHLKNPSETLKLLFPNEVEQRLETCILTYVPPR